MINFNKLESNKLYRTKTTYTLPYNPKAQNKGYMAMVFGESVNDTAEYFKNSMFQFKRYRRYYIDKRYNFIIANAMVRKIEDQKELFNTGFGNIFPGVTLCKQPSMTNGNNVIYELNKSMEFLYSDPRIEKKALDQRVRIKFNFIIDRLADASAKFPEYKKFLFIPINKYISNPRSSTIWSRRSELDNNLVMFLRMIEDHYDVFKSRLPDYTFVFTNVNELFFLNCRDFDAETFETIKGFFKKMKSRHGVIDTTECDDDYIDSEDDNNEDILKTANENKAVDAINQIKKSINHNNIQASDEDINTIIPEIETKVKDRINKLSEDTPKVVKQEVEEPKNITSSRLRQDTDNTSEPEKTSTNKLISNDEITDIAKETIEDHFTLNNPALSAPRLARLKKIKSEIKDVVFNNETVGQILAEKQSKKIVPARVKADVMNEDIKTIPMNNFEKGYNKNLMNHDLVNILTSFANKDRPLYLIKLDREDTSTVNDQLYTYTAVFEDEYGRRHNLKFDMPKFVDEKFVHISGSDKLFINQVIPIPVTKVAPDEVQISSNYNKIFISRFGKNVSSKISKFHKTLPNVDGRYVKVTNGNNLSENALYPTTIEYDELSKKYHYIEIPDEGIKFYFNQKEIRDICEREDLAFNETRSIPFGIQKNKNGDLSLIVIDVDSDTVTNMSDEAVKPSTVDFIIAVISVVYPSFKNDFIKNTAGKKMIYTRAVIMKKKVPVVLLLSFLNGLEPFLNKAKIKHQFMTTRPNLKEDSLNKGIIKFKDGYLVYDLHPFNNSLLMNGFGDVPTEEYNYLDFSTKDVYYDIFQLMFGRRNIGTAFENFEQLFIDPITKEVLEDYQMPTNFTDLIVYANALLENNTYDLDGDMKNYRIRTNELVNVHLYKLLSKAYEKYRTTADNKTPSKMSIKQDDVLKDIFSSQIFEEYSTLNPIFEIDRMRSTSYKGPGGCNVDRAFSIEKRAYNESMLGIFSQSSPVSSNVGISRTLALNPNITSLRGYLKPGSQKEVKKLNGTNLMSGAELLLPMTATHDDSQRVSMASTQSRHTMSTMDSDTPLFGYGMDKVLAKTISDRFVFKAKDKGEVTEINDKLGYMAVKYKSGKTDIIDITNRQALNTGAGFFVTNKLVPNFEVGHKFEEGEVLARNDNFFKYDDLTGDTVYKTGPLARIAVIHGSCVFEDSTIVTERLADRLSSQVTRKKEIKLGKHSNIYSMVKLGDKVKAGDPLMIFDESYQDEYLNQLLSKINNDAKEDIIEAGRTPIKSKVNGEIIDIKIYHTCDKSELSESLQAIINDYERNLKERTKRFIKLGVDTKDLISLNENTSKIELKNDKIKGVKMGDSEVLIEFYIRSIDKFGIGDKLTYSVALKGVNHGLIPRGEEPYVGNDPNEKIDAFMSVSGYYSRMTNSFALSLMLNTIMIGMEKKIKDILDK